MRVPAVCVQACFAAGLLLIGGPGALAARSRCHVDPRGRAVLRMEMAHGTSWRLPGGCATIVRTRVCVPAVTVDRRRVPDLQVLAGDVAWVTAGPGRGHNMRSSGAVRAGVAGAVFAVLIENAASHDRRIHVTRAQARRLAQHELSMYRSSPPPCGLMIPRGETPRQYFLSARAIEGYREGLMVGRERDLILRHYPAMPPIAAFRRWLAGQLPHHTVRINGKRPSFSIAAAYPG